MIMEIIKLVFVDQEKNIHSRVYKNREFMNSLFSFIQLFAFLLYEL